MRFEKCFVLVLLSMTLAACQAESANPEAKSPEQTQESVEQSNKPEDTDDLPAVSKENVVSITYETTKPEVLELKAKPVADAGILNIRKIVHVGDTTIYVYTKPGEVGTQDSTYYTGMFSNMKLYEIGQSGYGDPNDIRIAETSIQGKRLVRIEGAVGASAPVADYIAVDKGVPASYLHVDGAIQDEIDLDGDGIHEIIVARGGTEPEADIFKWTEAAGWQLARLNILLDGKAIWNKHTQRILVSSPSAQAIKVYTVTPAGLKLTDEDAKVAGAVPEGKPNYLWRAMPVFNGEKTLDLTINGKTSSATFKHDIIGPPFGLFIPPQMEEYKMEDGTEWGFDNQQGLLSILAADRIAPEINFSQAELAAYPEYLGSMNDRDLMYTDYFTLKYENVPYTVRLSYRAKEKDKALPMFLEVIRQIRYVPQATKS